MHVDYLQKLISKKKLFHYSKSFFTKCTFPSQKYEFLWERALRCKDRFHFWRLDSNEEFEIADCRRAERRCCHRLGTSHRFRRFVLHRVSWAKWCEAQSTTWPDTEIVLDCLRRLCRCRRTLLWRLQTPENVVITYNGLNHFSSFSF